MRSDPSDAYVEGLLSEVFGEPVAVAASHRVAPWAVRRYRLTARSGNGVPASVVVKWLRDDPNGFLVDPRQVRTECAALEFLAGLGFEPAPRVLAADMSRDLLVLADLTPSTPLDEPIRREGAEATAGARLAFVRSLGELHAATVGRSEVYAAVRRTYGPADPQVERQQRFLGLRVERVRQYAGALGVRIPDAVERELADVLVLLADPGDFAALSGGDPGQNNFLVIDRVDGDRGEGASGWLIDFEFAGYRHTLGDLGFFGMAASYLAMGMARLQNFDNLDTRAPGGASRRQRVATLEAAADAAEHHRQLPNLTGWVRAVAAALRRRWRDADIDLSTYPGYTPRS